MDAATQFGKVIGFASSRGRHGPSVFLHDHRAGDDTDHAILEAIMTGPSVIAHWINFQYYASTVDNVRYGSGNKVLHTIVGGHLGVFEGNGGDLRIGLSLQSLHDGERWVYAPLRLAVFIEAPGRRPIACSRSTRRWPSS